MSLPAELVEAVFSGLEPELPHFHLHLLVDLDRRLDLPVLERALVGLVDAFPVLGCRYRRGWWRDRWVPWQGEPASRVQVQAVHDVEAATRALVRCPWRSDLEPPVRFTFLRHGGGGRLVLSLLHMVADGGGVKAAGGVLAALLAGVDPAPLPTADRRLTVVPRSLRLRDLPVLARELVREGLLPLSMLRVRPLRLELGAGDGGTAPSWRTAAVEPTRPAGATVNDLLVAALLRMAAQRSDRGPVGVAFSVDLRRFLRDSLARVTNLAGATVVTLSRARAGGDVLAATSARIGEVKRRLPGLPYMLGPALLFGWLPHALVRGVGRAFIHMVLRRGARVPILTNIGPLDEALAPLGDAVRSASIVGPFLHDAPVPVVTATGFRGALTLQVGGTGTWSAEALERWAAELGEAVGEVGSGGRA